MIRLKIIDYNYEYHVGTGFETAGYSPRTMWKMGDKLLYRDPDSERLMMELDGAKFCSAHDHYRIRYAGNRTGNCAELSEGCKYALFCIRNSLEGKYTECYRGEKDIREALNKLQQSESEILISLTLPGSFPFDDLPDILVERTLGNGKTVVEKCENLPEGWMDEHKLDFIRHRKEFMDAFQRNIDKYYSGWPWQLIHEPISPSARLAGGEKGEGAEAIFEYRFHQAGPCITRTNTLPRPKVKHPVMIYTLNGKIEAYSGEYDGPESFLEKLDEKNIFVSVALVYDIEETFFRPDDDHGDAGGKLLYGVLYERNKLVFLPPQEAVREFESRLRWEKMHSKDTITE